MFVCLSVSLDKKLFTKADLLARFEPLARSFDLVRTPGGTGHGLLIVSCRATVAAHASGARSSSYTPRDTGQTGCREARLPVG